LLGGLADPTLDEWLPTLTGSARAAAGDGTPSALRSDELRQWPRGAALLVAGRHPPVRLRLAGPRPWVTGPPIPYDSWGAPFDPGHPRWVFEPQPLFDE